MLTLKYHLNIFLIHQQNGKHCLDTGLGVYHLGLLLLTNIKFCFWGFSYTSTRLLTVIMMKIINTENQEILEAFVMQWMLVWISDCFWYCFQTRKPDLTSMTITLFKGKKSIQNWAQIKWLSHNKQWMVEAF